VLVSGGRFTLIDWENAAAGSFLDPLARCLAMTREYLSPHAGFTQAGFPESAIAWLTEGFAEIIPLDPSRRSELHLREMISHLSAISWKLGWHPDPHPHVLAMAERVATWHALQYHCSSQTH
jgi:hypothetical protein